MKIWDKIKSSIHPEDEEGGFDDEFDDDYPVNGNNNMGPDMGDFISGAYSSNPYGNSNQNYNNNNNNVNPAQMSQNYQQAQSVPMQARDGGLSVSGSNDLQSSVELKVVKPENFDSVAKIANLLMSNKTVVLNLEETNKELGRRLLDFLAGTAYAIKGDVKKVAEKTYIITSSSTVISAEQIKQETDERKDNGGLY